MSAAVFTPEDAEADLWVPLRVATLFASYPLKRELAAFMRKGLQANSRVDLFVRGDRLWARFTFSDSDVEHIAALDCWPSHLEPREAAEGAA